MRCAARIARFLVRSAKRRARLHACMRDAETTDNQELRPTSSSLAIFSTVESAIVEAQGPVDIKAVDDKLAVLQELFRRERLTLSKQNEIAKYRIRAQRRGGELLAQTVRPGRPSKSSQAESFSLPEGIDRNISSRWQALARIHDDKLTTYLKAQESIHGEVTVSGFLSFACGNKAHGANGGTEETNPHFSSESDEWWTPKDILERVVQVLGVIDLDPCSNSRDTPNVPAKKLFTKEDDGLSRQWVGKVYMNPPYGRELPLWLNKLVGEHATGKVGEALALVPSRTDTDWFHKLRRFPRCFLFGRLQFSGHDNSAPFPSMVVYLGKNSERFYKVFAELGDIYVLMASS